MKRFYWAVLIFALTSSLVFTSCGKKDGDTDTEDEGAYATVTEEGDITLSFMMWGDPKEKSAVYSVLHNFQVENPEIGIKVIHVDSLNFPDKLLAMFAGGEAPDVFYLFIEDFYRYASTGDLYPLDEFVNDPEFDLEDFYPQLVEKFMYGGSLYGIPKDWTSLVVYYNMDAFDSAGLDYPSDDWNWDEFLEIAKQLTIDKDGDGMIDQYGFLIEMWANWYYSWIKQNGGEIFDDNGNWVFADAQYLNKNAEALQFVADLANLYEVAPSAQNSANMGRDEAFMNQQVAMCMYGRWVQLKFKDIQDFRWDYAPLPQNTDKAAVITTAALAISRDTMYPEEAWKLLDYVTSYEGQINTAEAGLAVPSRMSLIESEHYLAAPEVIKFQPHLVMESSDEDPFVQQMEYGVYIAKTAEYLEVRQKLDEQLEDVFIGNSKAKEKIMTIDTMVSEILSGDLDIQMLEGDEE